MNALLHEARAAILVVDDTPDNIDILRAVLKNNFRVQPATNGATALKIARSMPAPDLILLDLLMPEMDGFAVLAELKRDPATRDIPVIFITAETDATSEARGLQAGAVDYITKPINPAIVRARVATHLALRQAQRELEARNLELLEERRLVEDILSRMRSHPQFDPRHLRLLMEPVERANGDIVLSAFTREGHQWVLAGDFTGHGLRAAMAAPLVAHAFYSEASANGDIVRAIAEINQILCRQLPTGFFMAACIAEIAPARDWLRLWRAGMPECLLFDAGGALREAFAEARLLPMGVLEEQDFEAAAVEAVLRPGDRLYVFSDGITEVANPGGELFGLARLVEFLTARDPAVSLDELLAVLECFHGSGRFDDDITLIEVQA